MNVDDPFFFPAPEVYLDVTVVVDFLCRIAMAVAWRVRKFAAYCTDCECVFVGPSNEEIFPSLLP